MLASCSQYIKDYVAAYLELARKWSGRSNPGTFTCDSSLMVWLTPHMRTLSIGSLARKSFTF